MCKCPQNCLNLGDNFFCDVRFRIYPNSNVSDITQPKRLNNISKEGSYHQVLKKCQYLKILHKFESFYQCNRSISKPWFSIKGYGTLYILKNGNTKKKKPRRQR